jgi:hypothetical protein
VKGRGKDRSLAGKIQMSSGQVLPLLVSAVSSKRKKTEQKKKKGKTRKGEPKEAWRIKIPKEIYINLARLDPAINLIRRGTKERRKEKKKKKEERKRREKRDRKEKGREKRRAKRQRRKKGGAHEANEEPTNKERLYERPNYMNRSSAIP